MSADHAIMSQRIDCLVDYDVTLLRVLFVSLYYPPATVYGGPIVSAGELSKSLAVLGNDVLVVTTNANGRRKMAHGTQTLGPRLRVHYCRRIGGGLFAPGMLVQIFRAIHDSTVIYVWGILIWLLPAILLLARFRSKRLIVSTRGMLLAPAVSTSRRKKFLFLALLKAAGIERWAVFHATSAVEQESVFAMFPEAKVALVPNGVVAGHSDRASDGEIYFLVLGRIHPIKQLEKIILAFDSAMAGNGVPARLVIAGMGEDAYVNSVRRLVDGLPSAHSIVFAGEVGGDEKWDLLKSARALILFSKSENFGMSAAEALSIGTPVIANRNTPWSGLIDHRCGWWIPDDVEVLRNTVIEAIEVSPTERRAMGTRASDWMEADYSWEKVAKELMTVMQSDPRLCEPTGRSG